MDPIAGTDLSPTALGAAPATSPQATPSPAARPVDDGLLEDELLVEEISIDGMCGVY